MSNDYVHVVLNLGVVMLLIAFLVFLLKKLKMTRQDGTRKIQILNMVSIGAKERIIMLEANNKTLLIGATPNSISTLHVFDEVKELSDESDEPVLDHESFAEQIKGLTG